MMSTKLGDSSSNIRRSLNIELKISKGLQRDNTGHGTDQHTSLSVKLFHESNGNTMGTQGEVVTSIEENGDSRMSASPSPEEHGSGWEIAPRAAASTDPSQGADFVPETQQSAVEMEGVAVYFKKIYVVKVLDECPDDPERTYYVEAWIGRAAFDDCSLANSVSLQHRLSTGADGSKSAEAGAADAPRPSKRTRTGK
jgi:hypothetical protein